MSQLSNVQVASAVRVASSGSVASSSPATHPVVAHPVVAHPVIARPGSLPVSAPAPSLEPEAVARTLYTELRNTGFSEQQVIALAGELLSLVTADVRSQASG